MAQVREPQSEVSSHRCDAETVGPDEWDAKSNKTISTALVTETKWTVFGEVEWQGDRTVAGSEVTTVAGSVVTRDIPEGVFAAGNPCRVIREIRE